MTWRPLSGISSTRDVVDHLTDARTTRFNQRRVRLDFDLIGNLANFQYRVDYWIALT